MKKNPFLIADDRIIRQLYGNEATLEYHLKNKTYNQSTGELSETDVIFSRLIHIGNPSEFSEALIDGKNIMRGDITCEVSRKALLDSLATVAGDPVVVVGQLSKSLSDLRASSIMHAGIDLTSDRIVFGGRTYSIRKVNPKNVYANEPSIYKLHLREVN